MTSCHARDDVKIPKEILVLSPSWHLRRATASANTKQHAGPWLAMGVTDRSLQDPLLIVFPHIDTWVSLLPFQAT